MDTEPIAIIGIGCRFPGAANPEAFWHLLRDGVDAIDSVPPDRWDPNSCSTSDPTSANPQVPPWGGFLERVDQFDPQFFGIAPREVISMDPKQRLLLEVAWEALEDAGRIPEQLAGTATGVFVGISNFDYYGLLMTDSHATDAYAVTGNTNCIAANRISYAFNFRGPSLAIDSACSSSLVAVHLACQSLYRRESSLALAAGVHVILLPQVTASLTNAGMISTTGRCKAFDAQADGFVRGEGAGVVVLRLLSQALADGDPIYAVIRGSAINQDGRSNGLTAPNLQAQEALLRQVYQRAGISPGSVQYVEAQGTGTLLGDAIELEALATVLVADRPPGDHCRIGSVKTNIGHLEAASGIAGLSKVALSLKHGQIPPSLHFRQPNPYVALDKLPLRVQQTLEPWSTDRQTTAGISAFGFGGTNAHVVLEAAPEPIGEPAQVDRPLHVLTLSAKTETALRALARRYQQFLANHPDATIVDVCFSANTGRTPFNHRLAAIADSTAQLAERLEAFALGRQSVGLVSGSMKPKKPPKIGFLFTGLMPDTLGPDRQLYNTQPTFRRILDRCDAIAQPLLVKSLLDILYPPTADGAPADETAQCTALFALQVALCELWKSWGIEPTVIMGTSLGEFAAACVAGVFSLEDGFKMIVSGSTIQEEGAMVGVFADEERVAAAIQPYADQVAIAFFGGPQIVISGQSQVVQAVTAALEAEGVQTIRWNASYAYHSPVMESEADFVRHGSEYTFSEPQTPVISGATGRLSTAAIATPEYWSSMVHQPVRFATGVQTMHQQGVTVFVEIGPKPILLPMGIPCLPEGVGVWLPSLRPGQSNWQQLLLSLAQLYSLGAPVNWSGFDGDCPRHRLRLPTYPFERQRYWLDTDRPSPQRSTPSPPPRRSLISTLLDEGDSEQVAQLLAKTEPFSPEQVQLLPKLLASLVRHHQATALSTHEHESSLTSQAASQDFPFPEVAASEPTIASERSPMAASPEEQQHSLENYLTEQVAKVLVLPPSQLDRQQPLNTLGLDSLMAIQLTNELRTDLALELPLEALFEVMSIVELSWQLQTQLTENSLMSSVSYEAPTVAGQAETIERIQQEGPAAALAGISAIDLDTEVVLDPAIALRGAPAAEDVTDPAAVCLTGVTGFLGAFVLRELLEQTQAQIYCVVRAPTAAEGMQRIRRNLESYALWSDHVAARITPVQGDLAQPLWGLSEQEFQTLARTIDVIYHCGAWVNFTYPYTALKAANVLSVQEALRLASQVKVKALHFVSSVAVFSPGAYGKDSIIREDNPLQHSTGFFSGYAATKWVAEKIIAIARQRGVPACIYRPGVIGGDSRTGIGNTKDLIWNIIKGCIQLGMIPDIDTLPDVDTVLNITPVDYVSRAIVQLSRRPESLERAFHFSNPQPMHWREFADFLRNYGYPLRQISNEEWQEVLFSVVARSPENALFPFMPLKAEEEAHAHTEHAKDLQFDCRNTLAGLTGSDIVCPGVDRQLLATYFAAFIRSGFLEAPLTRVKVARAQVGASLA